VLVVLAVSSPSLHTPEKRVAVAACGLLCRTGDALRTLPAGTDISLAMNGQPYVFRNDATSGDPIMTLLRTQTTSYEWTYTVASATTLTTFSEDDIETDLKGNFYVPLRSTTTGALVSGVKLAATTGAVAWTLTTLCTAPAGSTVAYQGVTTNRGGGIVTVYGVAAFGTGPSATASLFGCFIDANTGAIAGSFDAAASNSGVPAAARSEPSASGYGTDDMLYTVWGKTTVVKVNPRGVTSTLWVYNAPDTIDEIAAVGTNGMLYLLTKRSFIIGLYTSNAAMSNTARAKFMVRLGVGSRPYAFLSSSNVLYVAYNRDDDAVYGVSGSTGKVLWSHSVGSLNGDVTLGPSGYIHVSTNSTLFAIDATSSGSSKKSDSGAIAGAVIGSLLGMALLCGIVLAVLMSTGVLVKGGGDKHHNEAPAAATANPVHAKH
jgi:hypothetical protein